MGNVCSRMCPSSPCRGRRYTRTPMEEPDPPVEKSIEGIPTDTKPFGLGMSGGANYQGVCVGVNYGEINASTGAPLIIPGTVCKETLKLWIINAKETFVPTQTFHRVNKKLKKTGHVTICGASGEGKTTMALMLAHDYQEKDYDVCYVDRTDIFDFNQCISSTHKMLLIFDDLFGSHTEVTNLKRILNSLSSHILDYRERSMERSSKRKQKSNENQKRKDISFKEIRVVFISKTYNFSDAISMFQHERLSLFKEETVVDVTTDKNHCYTHEEKVAIFERYKHDHQNKQLSNEFIWKLDDMLFGFPLTCRLYFKFHYLHEADSPEDFFKHPLLYLEQELKSLLGSKDDKSAALILMILCEDRLDLSQLELERTNQNMDKLFKHVTNIVPNATRSGVAISARSFIGTYFSGTDILRFTHSSIYDACASALYEINQAYVFQYCSYDFLYERLKPVTSENEDFEKLVNEHHGFIFLTSSYYNLFATKLARGISEGYFANTVTHPALKDDKLVDKLVELFSQKLKTESGHVQNTNTSWVHQKDRGKGLLYWAVLGPSPRLVYYIENEMNIKTDEVIESLEGCVEKDDKELLINLSYKLQQKFDGNLKNRLLLLSAKTGSSATAKYLISERADINGVNNEMENLIHIACQVAKSKMHGVLQDLLTESSQQAALNAKDSNGRTPIMIAALSSYSEGFHLLAETSNLDIQDDFGDSLFHLACQGGGSSIVKYLLKSFDVNSRGRHGWTPLMMTAVKGHKHLFDLLFNEDALKIKTDSGDSLLHLACQGGNRSMIEHVLPSYNIDIRGENGWTPLMVSAVAGHLNVFKCLIDKGANWHLADNDNDSLLHLACLGGNLEIVQQVLNVAKPDIDMLGQNSWTPVMVAASEGHLSVFRFLVSKNANLTLVNDKGDSLLHLACQGGNIETVKLVVELSKSDVDMKGENSWTPVMVAAVEGYSSVFKYLVSQNADLTQVDADNDSLIHLACQGGNTDIVQYLLENTQSNINSLGQYGWTPIMVAAAEGHQSVFEFLHSNDADLNILDVDGSRILHIACQGGNISIVKELLTKSDINMTGMAGRTPIMIAAASGHKTLFDFLVSKNSNMELVDNNGNTLLHNACKGGNRNIVQHVVTTSNVNSRNGYNVTPAMVAARYGHKDILQLLLQNQANLFLVDRRGQSVLDYARSEDIVLYIRSILSE